MKRWRIGLVYNSKENTPVGVDAPPDALAEYDSCETVQGIARALREAGHEVVLLEADSSLLDTVRTSGVELCFNIAEGVRGDARESHVPALLEMLGIPYTGSKVLTHALSLDKAMAKRVWRDCGLPTAPFQLFERGDEPLAADLTFPLFVKPVREGSGMGIVSNSVVNDEASLRRQVEWVLQTYRQPALVEAYLPGREFTVGLIGNRRFPGEVAPSAFYDERGYHVFPILEIDVSPVSEAGGLYGSQIKSDMPLAPAYLCPAPIDDRLAEEMRRLAVAAFEALGALDVGRVDFRLGTDGRPYLMEINTLPGMNPVVSDIVMAARAEGVSYTLLINEVLQLALQRYGLAALDAALAVEMPVRRMRRLIAARRSRFVQGTVG